MMSHSNHAHSEGPSANGPLALLLPPYTCSINAPVPIPRLLPSRVLVVHHFVRNPQSPRPAATNKTEGTQGGVGGEPGASDENLTNNVVDPPHPALRWVQF